MEIAAHYFYCIVITSWKLRRKIFIAQRLLHGNCCARFLLHKDYFVEIAAQDFYCTKITSWKLLRTIFIA